MSNSKTDKAMHPIAFCPEHGFFPVTAFGLIGCGVKIHMRDLVTDCPACKRPSEILPGDYEVVGDRLQLLIDASISREALLKLREIAEQLQRAEISPQEAKRRAKAVAPKAAKLFDVTNWSDQARATVLAAIIGGISVIAATKLSSQTTVINITHQPVIERVVPEPQPRKMALPGLPGGPPLKI